MRRLNKKGQESVLGGDLPAIIMIVMSIGFFLSSIYIANNTFSGKKASLQMEAALVDAASVFLKENAKIKPEDVTTSASDFWTGRIRKITQSYGVQIYVELESLNPSVGDSGPWDSGSAAQNAADNAAEKLSKRFPVAIKIGDTDLEVVPGLVKVTVYIV